MHNIYSSTADLCRIDYYLAVRGAYRDFLARDRHPMVALFLEVPSDTVDVNVHPAKSEVRFQDGGLVRSLVVGGLRQALHAAGHRASTTVAQAALGAFQPESPLRGTRVPKTRLWFANLLRLWLVIR